MEEGVGPSAPATMIEIALCSLPWIAASWPGVLIAEVKFIKPRAPGKGKPEAVPPGVQHLVALHFFKQMVENGD